ncbi:M23 family metallopeptidase [Catellatospora sichuanensis]|uniref:M23 family metallopeptidase n=1 Tax=Catellatospora sichuanensis TaxID=1969805 RepID=UPI001FE6F471|nr:M23 family metallopeptidase [Catellatospora sichuanensis]
MTYRPELLKESERYRGRRRAPVPSRRRYAAVLATAAVGAGAVVLSSGAAIEDAKTDPVASGEVAAYAQSQGSGARADAAERANRSDERATATEAGSADGWVLPVHEYELRTRHGDPSQGIDLTGLPEGTPFAVVHEGTVVQAGWNGAFGYSVIVDHGDGVQTVYAHASKVLVKVGQKVAAGEEIALLGNTGLSRSPHLHLEVHVDGAAQNPLTWFQKRGLDFDLEIEAPYGA